MPAGGELGSAARALLLGAGLLLAFAYLLEGFHKAVEEAAGLALADHALRFCPNWMLGLFRGAPVVGVAETIVNLFASCSSLSP